jgi:uncharacterized protein YcbK (DUF882 family)
MRSILLVFLSALVTPTFALAASPTQDVAFVNYVPQTSRVAMSCFPASLKGVLRDLGKAFGRTVVVTSGHRGSRQARRGSQHRTCKAADVRIAGVSAGAIAKWARARGDVGGVGVYCGRRAGLVHIDVGPRRSWYHCGGSKKRRRS